MWKNTANDYGLIAQGLHWSVAMLILGLIGMGWWMVDLDYYDAWYHQAPALHKALGLVALALAATRVIWAISDRPPRLVAALHAWERLGATLAHHSLYVLTLVVPVTGYLISTARGEAIDIFGWMEVPALLPAAAGREEWAGMVHAWLAYATLALVTLHAVAAIKHQFIDRNGTLRRMAGIPKSDS